MKIGVYGDSFAGMNTRFFEGTHSPDDAGPAWVELLEDEGKHKVYNFSKSGTAFQYSYEKFLEHYKSFDLNIFVVTSPNRTYIKALDDILVFGEDWIDFQINRINNSSWYIKKDKHLKILESVRVYLSDWVDWEMRKHIQHLQVNNLWKLAPNTIVIPAFHDSIEQTQKNLNDLSSAELMLIDPDQYNKNPIGKALNRKQTVICRRKCHFSTENNRMLYELIDAGIKTGQKIIEPDISLLVEPKNKDYYYYAKIFDLSPQEENLYV